MLNRFRPRGAICQSRQRPFLPTPLVSNGGHLKLEHPELASLRWSCSAPKSLSPVISVYGEAAFILVVVKRRMRSSWCSRVWPQASIGSARLRGQRKISDSIPDAFGGAGTGSIRPPSLKLRRGSPSPLDPASGIPGLGPAGVDPIAQEN